MHRRRASAEANRFVPEHANALSFQGPRDPPMEMPVAAQAQSVAHGEIMIAQHGVDAQGRRQPAQRRRYPIDIPISFMHEIPGQHDDTLGLIGDAGRANGLLGRPSPGKGAPSQKDEHSNTGAGEPKAPPVAHSVIGYGSVHNKYLGWF